jgi:Na+/proline symporter
MRFCSDYTGLTLEEVRADESRVRRFHPDDVARLREERRMALLRGEPFGAKHMLLQSETLRPMLKTWSPMSLGSWGLLLFGSFAFISFLDALADDDRERWPRLVVLRPAGFLGVLVVVIGDLLGFFLAGYTGVLLTVTNRPIWADTSWLGVLFLVCGASTAAALLEGAERDRSG